MEEQSSRIICGSCEHCSLHFNINDIFLCSGKESNSPMKITCATVHIQSVAGSCGCVRQFSGAETGPVHGT
jgi:hypothetical protein